MNTGEILDGAFRPHFRAFLAAGLLPLPPEAPVHRLAPAGA